MHGDWHHSDDGSHPNPSTGHSAGNRPCCPTERNRTRTEPLSGQVALRVLVSQCSEDVLLAIRDARILRTRALRRTLVNRRCTLGSKWQPAPNVEPLLNDAYEQAQDPPQCVQYEGMKNWYLIFLMSPDWMTSLAFFFFFSWSAAIEPTFPIRGRSEKDFYFIFNFVGKTYLNTEKCLGVICHKRLNTQAFMNVHVDELDGGLTSVALTKTNSCQKKKQKGKFKESDWMSTVLSFRSHFFSFFERLWFSANTSNPDSQQFHREFDILSFSELKHSRSNIQNDSKWSWFCEFYSVFFFVKE